ncbi:MAG TPA: MarR family transcriptional regulator [Acidimicrobiales bacterium]|nr:MAG: hypothetical protein B7Z69_03045 [Actinobacteria bacterium 21-73-9]HQU26065.1 MarR family transcriptional regulator [Acidimicrobiales bacterium]
MTQGTGSDAAPTTLEREWGRLRRGQLLSPLRQHLDASEGPLQLEILREVADAGGIRASELADRLHVTKASISRYVAQMVASGLLATRPDPRDGRAALLSATAGGRRALARREARRSRALARLCEEWSAHDVEALTRLLRRLNDGIDASLRAERRPVP